MGSAFTSIYHTLQHQRADGETQSLTMMPTLHTLPAVGPSPPEISRLYLSMAFLITACQSTPSGTCSHQHSCMQPPLCRLDPLLLQARSKCMRVQSHNVSG